MLPLEQPDRIQIAFDDHRLVANAGLILPVTLAQRLGLSQLVDRHVDLGRAPGRANTGDKMMTLVASALAGGDCIDDADVLRTGGTAGAIGCVVKAPSTLGTFLRSFRWGHVRQLDRVSRELLALAWSAGAGPGDAPLTIDLDSTICETFGLAKEGARHHGYTGQRGYHPLLARVRTTWAGTGDVLMCRLREGRANTVRGAAHFLRETVGRVRYAGASGQLTVRADSGFYAHALVAVCRNMDVRFSITIRQHQSLRNIIEAIPEEDWTAIPYWLDGAAAVAETSYTPFQSEPNAAPVRLIVRRVKPTPGSQLALFANYRYHGCITDRDGDTLDLEADHRRHAEIENAIRDLKYGVGLNHLPSGRFPANPEPAEGGLAVRPGHRPQPGSLDSAHRSGRATGDHQDPQATLLLPGRTAHPLSAPTHPAPATTLALGKPVQSCPGKIPRPPAPSLTAATSPPTRHPPHGTSPPTRTNPVREGHSFHTACRITSDMTTAGHQNRAGVATSRRPHPHLWNQTCPARLPLPIIPGFNPSDHRFGGFGLRYANNDKGLGIVLTPPHIAELLAELADVNKTSVVYDNCCGTGGLLIAAMKRMLQDNTLDPEKEREIKNRQLIGLEFQDDIYALAVSNMVVHGDGKTNILAGNCFKLGEKFAAQHKPNIGLLNPPYKTKGSKTEELEFVLNNLESLQPGGTCVAILPIGCAIGSNTTLQNLKRRILERHTLEAVMSMPSEVFHDSKVGVVTCVMVITAHHPHPQGKKTWFGYWRDDGLVITKHLGRADVNKRWAEIKSQWVNAYRNRELVPGQSVSEEVTDNDEWCGEAYMETDYSGLTSLDFENEVKKYVAYRILNEQ